jgi:hypothetical protein
MLGNREAVINLHEEAEKLFERIHDNVFDGYRSQAKMKLEESLRRAYQAGAEAMRKKASEIGEQFKIQDEVSSRIRALPTEPGK